MIFAGANCLENKMATSSVEEKQLVVEGMICGLSSDELKNLADHLEIPVMQYVGKSKLLISKLVRDKLYEEVGDRSTEADRLTFLGGIENKHLYDRRVNTSQLEPGDRVLVRNLSQRGGPGKLRSHWEERVHVVIKQKGSLPVYEVQSEDQRGPKRRLHRNLLLPCELLPLEIPVPDSKESEPVTPAPVHRDPIGDADSDNSSSDSEDDQQPAQVRPVRHDSVDHQDG